MATLADIRQSVARRMRDHIQVTVTTNATETNAFADSRRLLDVNGAYAGTWFEVISAANVANVGHTARIANSEQSTGKVAFAPATPELLQAGDVIHLYNLYGKGYKPWQYDEFIGDCIGEAFPAWLEYHALDLDPLERDTFAVDLPSPFTHVYGLEVAHIYETGLYVEIPLSMFRIDEARQQLIFTPRLLEVYYGQNARVTGYKRHPIPTANDDEISVPRNWLIPAAASRMAARRTGDREWQEWAVEWGREAQGKEYELQRSRKNGTVRIRD